MVNIAIAAVSLIVFAAIGGSIVILGEREERRRRQEILDREVEIVRHR